MPVPFPPERVIESLFEYEIIRLQAGIIEYEVRLTKASSSNGEYSEVERLVYNAILSHLRKELREMAGFNMASIASTPGRTGLVPLLSVQDISESLEAG